MVADNALSSEEKLLQKAKSTTIVEKREVIQQVITAEGCEKFIVLLEQLGSIELVIETCTKKLKNFNPDSASDARTTPAYMKILLDIHKTSTTHVITAATGRQEIITEGDGTLEDLGIKDETELHQFAKGLSGLLKGIREKKKKPRIDGDTTDSMERALEYGNVIDSAEDEPVDE